MSRTYRKELNGALFDQRYVVSRSRNGCLVRDGRQSFFTIISRDNRSTGLREHRKYRTRTRVELKCGNDDAVLVGKKRRYGDRYGTYEW